MAADDLSKAEFRFRKSSSVGIPHAEQDSKFLDACFVNNGLLDIALDTNEPKIFLHGRTGSGKTALIKKINSMKPKQVILIRPETLALNHISNSTIIKFFEELEVRMDLFYKLLWRHTLAVEILKKKYEITTPKARNSWLMWLKDRFDKDEGKNAALEYIQKFGDSFWKETDERIAEITTTIERELSSQIGSDLSGIMSAGAKGRSQISEQQRAEIKKRGQEVVSKVKIRELDQIIRMLDEDILTDDQHPYYVLIDGLDEDWVEDRLRYKLIKALLEAARDFCRIKNAKVIVAIRRDLMERVFRSTRHDGQQEEKYMSLCIDLRWKRNDLIDLIDRRIRFLIQEQYTSKEVGLKQLLPTKISKQNPEKYILDRTLLRPRDAIVFINECINLCEGKQKFTATMIQQAERAYSKNRLNSVCDEWYADYPELSRFAFLILHGRSHSFYLHEISENEFDSMCIELASSPPPDCKFLWSLLDRRFDGNISLKLCVSNIFAVFFKTGLVGLRLTSKDNYIWSFNEESIVSSDEIEPNTRVMIHHAFRNALSVAD